MQDNENTLNPDVNSFETENEAGGASEVDQNREEIIERRDPDIPVPPDSQPSYPIEDPPDKEKTPIDEDNQDKPTLIM